MHDQQSYYKNKLNYEIDSSDLYQSLEEGGKIIVIDARSTDAYEKEHIPGAINIPHRTMSAESTSQLDKEALYICYCDGIGCNASTKGALNLLKLGFKVKELVGGLEWWRIDGYETHGSKACSGTKMNCAC
jgi:rhodanese-related sulfurtransferase